MLAMRKITNIVIIALLAISLVACSSGKSGENVAKVNGKFITAQDFEKNLALTKKGYEGLYGEEIWTKDAGDGKTFNELIKEQVLETMISVEVLYQEAQKKGVKVEDSEVDKALKEFKDNVAKSADMKTFLEKNKIDDEFIKDQLRKELAVAELEKNFKAELKLTDAEIKDYFEKNKENYRDQQVRASHILFKTVDDSMKPLPEDKVKEQEKLANEVLQKAKAGEDFAELAKKYSQDEGSAQNGGDLNFFGKGVMVPEFEEAAFKLEKGQISELVKSQFGYHIIKVTDRIDEIPAFDKVKDSIKSEIEQNKYNEYTAGLNKKAKVEKLLKDETKK